MNRSPNRSVEAVFTVLAAIAAALFGRLLFGYPPVPIVILIAAGAAAASIALVELIDHGTPARTTSTPAPRTPTQPKAPTPWWDQPPAAPEPAPPRRGDAVTVIDVRQWSRAAIERQYQCPTCGGFDISRVDGAAHRCNDCASSWSWQPPSPWPRVTIDVKARSGVRR